MDDVKLLKASSYPRFCIRGLILILFLWQAERLLALHDGLADCAKLVAARMAPRACLGVGRLDIRMMPGHCLGLLASLQLAGVGGIVKVASLPSRIRWHKQGVTSSKRDSQSLGPQSSCRRWKQLPRPKV